MSSRAGQRNKYIRVRFFNKLGIVETLVKKRHFEESFFRDKKSRYAVDMYGDRINFYDYEVIK